MKKTLKFLLGLLIIMPMVLEAQVNISGEISPSAMFRISDGSLIDLPFRAGNFRVAYSHGDFELKTTIGVESRWKDMNFSEDLVLLREAYLMWFPSFGEVKLGKMIHAWGAADANNPTDNLSAYDFYYMFLTGTERKRGSLSLSTVIYAGDFLLEFVALPQFVENRLPLNEPDFPISIPLPANAETHDPDGELELGARLKYALDMGDLSFSYFQAHDRMPSPAGLRIDVLATPSPFIPQLVYRNTNVLGLDGVLFPGNWTLRGELAYFMTESPDQDLNTNVSLTQKANYLQSIVQVEYAFSNGLQLTGQLISTDQSDPETTLTPDMMFLSLPDSVQQMVMAQYGQVDFQPGMGTPFAMISDRVMIFSSMLETLDNQLELRAMLMLNLEETGTMGSLGSSYELMEGVKLDAQLSIFRGGDEVDNSFKKLEDFSNVTLGLSYSF